MINRGSKLIRSNSCDSDRHLRGVKTSSVNERIFFKEMVRLCCLSAVEERSIRIRRLHSYGDLAVCDWVDFGTWFTRWYWTWKLKKNNRFILSTVIIFASTL